MSIVYKSDGTIRCIAKKIKYHSVYMKEDYIEVSIDSPSPIDFSNGDYIIYDYNGIKYTLSDPIGVKKQARKDTYSKAFVYTGIKFNSNFNLLFRCMFLDIVQEDNLNHYTSLPDVDTFEDVYGIAGRIQANLDNQYPNTFNIKIVDTTGNAELESILRTARAFNVSNGYCSDALSTIYNQWGVGYIYTVENGKDTIIIGGTAGESTVFRYGKNNGLRVITSDIQNLSELCNRIYPFGSTRNLPARWYNKKQYIQDLQYAPNLLIPKSKWGDNNPRSAFVENAESINKYGLRPKAIYWDGSDSDRIEVYPSIEGVTAGIIRQAKAEAEDTTYVPSTELYPNDELVDEILVGDNIEDDGLNIDTGYKLYSEQYAYAYNAEEGKDFQTSKIGTIGKDGAELGFAFTFEMPNKLTPFTLPKDAVYRIGSPDHELEVIGYNTLPYLYIPRTYAKSYATYLFSQNHPAYLVGRAEGTNDYWRWECSIEESDAGFTIRPITEQTISLKAGSSLFFLFEVSASILFSDSYAIEHLNEEIFATCYIRGGGFYIQRGLNYIFQDFDIYIKQIGFNVADYPSEDNNYITININTGSCAGRSFKIRKVEYDSALDRWKLNCYRSDDNTLSLRFPNSDFHISAGDKFVITNIQMPDLYVYMAMERLYNEALKELDLLSNPSRIYTPEIDNLQMARSPQVLRVGMFMPISDDDLNIQSDNAILIDSIEVNEGEDAIRTFSVTLRNEKQDNILKKNKRDIKSISVALKKSNSEASRVSSNESVNQDSTGATGGGTSVSSYDNLTNKPSINDVELKGNLTSEDLGLQPKGKYVIEDDFNKHTNNKDIHISSEEREKWNNKSDLTAEDVKGIKVNNAGHADSADNATKAGSADKLTNSRKIFGLPFDGTKDVVGGITADGDSVIRGNLNVTKDGIFGGEVAAIVGDAEPAGVTDYAQLQNKPAINGKELASGDNSLDALGIQPKGDYTTASQLDATLKNYATKVFVSNNYATKAAVNTIQALIPATATADNQLADKDFVNSSIATATAEFKGSFTSLDELKATSGNLNDYAFYLHTDDVGNKVVDRYKWTTAGWLYEYTLNNSSFTAEQWAALNSTITATLVQSYNSHLNNSTIHITSDERTAWNNKWDYNEKTIKGVKVNAAISADKATKLATARTIWGQSFDGSANVSGGINSCDFIRNNNQVGGYYVGSRNNILGDTEGGLYIGVYGQRKISFYTYSRSRMEICANGNILIGTTTDNGYKLDVNGTGHYSGDLVCGGEVVAVAGEGTPAGVTDYSALTGKPSINGVTLISGNNTLAALGIQAAGDYATNSGVTTLLTNYADKTFVSNNYVGKSAFNAHTADTDIHITAEERATWNAKWDYNEATIKAVKVTSASSADSVAWSGIKDKPTSLKNPYALAFGSKSYDGSAAATITASDLGALTAHQSIYAFTLQVNGTSQGVYNPASAAKTINIAVPTKTSDITNDSGFITSASIPTALKNPYAVEIKANGVSLGTYDGSAAATFNLSAANVGAASKVHSHTASEINGLPTKLSAFTNDVGYITGITKSMVEGVLTGDITSHTHNYLPLSGGEISGNITWNKGKWGVDVNSRGVFMSWNDAHYLHITNDGAFYNWKTLIHSGNYNSYSPTLTGTGASGTWEIDISGNASSATKLQDNTAFTAWGQTFFENGKPKSVSGDLSMGRSKIYWNGDIAGSYISSNGTTGMIYEMRDGHSFYVDGDMILSIAKYRNYNLDVYGTGHYSGDLVCGGEVVAVAGEGTPAGVTDYSALTGKPSINGVTLVSGNNTLAALGIQAAGDYATNSGVTTLLADYAKKTFVANNYAGKAAFNSHTADTDIHITASEREAWNAKWDYNEATIKAVKVNSASSADSVAWSGITGKPSTFTPSAHRHTASEVSGLPTSLKNPYALTFGSKTYDGSAAKTITASDLGALTAHQSIYALTLQVNGTSQGVYNPASAAKTINIAVPTKTSDITNDSGFITSAAIPTALKNPYAVEIKANGVSLGTYDGSAAATFNLSAANVGAANKVHSHTASEISGLPTNLSAFTNDVGYITGITKSMVEGVLTGDITSHTHSYLPLSGGTMTGSITIPNIYITGFNSRLPSHYYHSLYGGNQVYEHFGDDGDRDKVTYGSFRFFNGSGGYKTMVIGGDGTFSWDGSYVLTTSNYNSYSPKLDGTGATGTWGINISGNASSATKLQTPRTLWGKPFDGSNDVYGQITIRDNLGLYQYTPDGATPLFYIGHDSSHPYVHIYNFKGGNSISLFDSGNICIPKGNVLIGTTTDNGYKLQVNGSERVYGDLIVDGEVSALVV